MISKQAKYALRALIGLARAEPGRAVLTADLATQQRIPKKFLEQILLLLKRSGLVQSRRGALGGYVLIKPPQDIRFLDVLRLVDGPIAPLPCLSVTAYRRCLDCPDEASCEMRQAFQKVTEAMRRVLEETTIADALAAGDADSGERLRQFAVGQR
ncbi:MAG: Rrf2 family transcriptional regulator [Aestuariivirgaceae bacterium]|jgi:Rrf2 family protein